MVWGNVKPSPLFFLSLSLTFGERPQRSLHVAVDHARVRVPRGGEGRKRFQVVRVAARAQQQGPRPGAQGVGPQAAHDGHLAQLGEVDLRGEGEEGGEGRF